MKAFLIGLGLAVFSLGVSAGECYNFAGGKGPHAVGDIEFGRAASTVCFSAIEGLKESSSIHFFDSKREIIVFFGNGPVQNITVTNANKIEENLAGIKFGFNLSANSKIMTIKAGQEVKSYSLSIRQ